MTMINIMGSPVVMAMLFMMMFKILPERTYRLAGCLDWSDCHCRVVYAGTVGNRDVSWEGRR